MKNLIVIEGPTASGKTALGIALAKHFNTCVISADSRQFYKELSIGTAKPSREEQNGVIHHLVDSHSIQESVTSAQFEQEALKILEREFKSKDFVILVGGSGMFIDALCVGLDPIPFSEEVKTAINEEYKKHGLQPILEELRRLDPEYYARVDKKNPMRIIRAIEAIRITGKAYSDLRNSFSTIERGFKVHRFVINHEREMLYDRINKRVDLMMENGLLEEVRSLIHYQDLTPLNTVGYQELFQYLKGRIPLDDAINKIKMNTRRYAKRQLTWFRRHPEAKWIDYSETTKMIEVITSTLKLNSTDEN